MAQKKQYRDLFPQHISDSIFSGMRQVKRRCISRCIKRGSH